MEHNGNASDAWPEWPVMRLDNLGDPDARGFSVGDGDWPFRGVIVKKGGEFFAYANVCPHRRHPLDLVPDAFLTDNGNQIRCASHGALFVPETGECVAGPCVGFGLLVLPSWLAQDGTICIRAPDRMLAIGWSSMA
jgi:nitrite reductase/ring-hydroxylating ferredoxin subunit